MAKDKTKSYFEYTNGKKLFFEGIDEVPTIEAIEATPFERSFKDCLLKRREKLINSITNNKGE